MPTRNAMAIDVLRRLADIRDEIEAHIDDRTSRVLLNRVMLRLSMRVPIPGAIFDDIVSGRERKQRQRLQ